jgi:hypothetical protein
VVEVLTGGERRISRLVCVVLVVMLGAQVFASRGVLTPDGVSYFDLAQAVRGGEWRRFINGYWSPLYPLAISAIARVVPGRFDLLLAVHLMNATALAVAVVVIAWSVRAVRPLELRWLVPMCAGGLMVAFDVVGATAPDAALTLLATLVAVDITRHPEPRLRRGAVYGLMYLTKTSTLPWLVLMCAAELWLARKSGALRAALRMLIPAAVAVVAWLGAVSSVERRPTVGSTASLNWEWYGWGIRSRFPDTDPAGHLAYIHPSIAAVETAGGAQALRLADFGSTVATYLPWSDPAGWSRGRIPPTPDIASPVVRAVERGAVNLWLNGVDVLKWSLAMLALLCCWWPRRGAQGRSQERWAPGGALLAGSGLAGTAIMCVVHVEQRLVLPWLVLFAVGGFLLYEQANAGKGSEGEWRWPAWLRSLAVAAFAITSFVAGSTAYRKDRLDSQGSAQREAARGVAGPAASGADSSVVVVGSVTALIPELWLHGQRAVAQLVDPAFTARPANEREAILTFLALRYRGRAGSMWVVDRRSRGVERRGAGPEITNYIDVVSMVKVQ